MINYSRIIVPDIVDENTLLQEQFIVGKTIGISAVNIKEYMDRIKNANSDILEITMVQK